MNGFHDGILDNLFSAGDEMTLERDLGHLGLEDVENTRIIKDEMQALGVPVNLEKKG